MNHEVKEKTEALLRSGERQKAIAYLQDTFKIQPAEATLLVETLEREEAIGVPDEVEDRTAIQPGLPATVRLPDPLRTEVGELLKAGRQSEALKRVRDELKIGMREALMLIGEVARAQNPRTISLNPMGCVRVIAKGIGIFLMVVSTLFLVIAAVLYFYRERSIANSERVAGVVTEMKSMDGEASAPVVEFEWKGRKRSYESTYYSDPPDYQQGQRLFLFVNRDDPEEIRLDTFEDRWALIVGLSVPGGFFLIISIVILYFARRKF